MNRCKFCNSDGTAEFGLLPIRDYDWDSADDTALSIRRVTGHMCADRGGCARRIVEQGTSIESLRQVIADREHLPADLVERARVIMQEWRELAEMTALAEDAASREDGWGVMTGGRA